ALFSRESSAVLGLATLRPRSLHLPRLDLSRSTCCALSCRARLCRASTCTFGLLHVDLIKPAGALDFNFIAAFERGCDLREQRVKRDSRIADEILRLCLTHQDASARVLFGVAGVYPDPVKVGNVFKQRQVTVKALTVIYDHVVAPRGDAGLVLDL